MEKVFDTYVHMGDGVVAGLVKMLWPADAKREWSGPIDMGYSADVVLSKLLPPYGMKLQLNVSAPGVSYAAHSVTVDLFTGGATDGDLVELLRNPSIPDRNGVALSYGFWDSGGDLWRSVTPLPPHDQAYVYLTRSHVNWMGELVALEPKLKKLPFGTFVLPGSHDAGMFDATRIDQLLFSIGFEALKKVLQTILIPFYAIPVIGPALAIYVATLDAEKVRRIMINMAFTQKDDIKTQLDLGARLFDFRPGYLLPVLRTVLNDDTLYHQHMFVPGQPYKAFLVDILSWLEQHPTEIAVVHYGFWGFFDQNMVPTPEALARCLKDAQNTVSGKVQVGTNDDMGSTYEKLLEANKRLLLLYGEICYSSYDYGNSVDPNSVLTAVGKMNRAGQEGKLYTSFSLQSTGTNIPEVAAWGALATTNATSPLMATKAMFDHVVYPWLSAEVPKKDLDPTQLLCLSNDFVDNALTSRAIDLTRRRIAQVVRRT